MTEKVAQKVKTVLAIGGSDPSGEAGIQVDLQVLHSLKVPALSTVTAVTAQNDERFYSLNPAPSTLIREQLRAVVSRYRPKVVKIGLLGTKENVLAVYRFLQENTFEEIILDPVLWASTGNLLLAPGGIAVLKEFVIPMTTVVTPNLREAAELTGREVKTVDQMREAAIQLHRDCRGVKYVLIKGGHLEGEPVDVLYDGNDWRLYDSKERFLKHVHGTGCVFSAALAAHLAHHQPMVQAVKNAKKYITEWIRKKNLISESPDPAPVS